MNIEDKLVEAVNEMEDEEKDYSERMMEILNDKFTGKELLDKWLEYEGIIGYTDEIIEMVKFIQKLELNYPI